MPKASVVIPTYNQARFIAAAVESALAQTCPDVEIIVVDDGSTDDTQAVLSDYRDTVHTIYQQNRGLAGARNTGFLASRGDYLLFLDSDDLMHPDKLAAHVALLEAEPDFGLVYSAWQQISADGTEILGEVRPHRQGQLLKELLLRQFFFFASAAVVRRECMERVGLFDESLRWNEDADMWLRLARAGHAFGYIDRPLLQYRIHPDSMTANIDPEQVQGWLAGLDKFFAAPDLPDDIRALEAEAYSVLHYETAARYYRAGQIEQGQEHLGQAISICPVLDEEWLLEWIAGTALDPRTRHPDQFIDLLFDNLSPEASSLRSLRRRARGRYHTAAAFSAYRSHNLKRARAHILPALREDPSIIRSRGF
ncbi:MAG: glycosyltransferase, partial [Anaerolineae bacterium]|nr:glycosyltransferase [Anaerolineae bacterium]